MYHDEFARKSTRTTPHGEDAMPTQALEFGGGLSLGLAASLNPPISMMVFGLGGLIPMVTCCLSIAAHRATEVLNHLGASPQPPRPSIVPAPHARFAASRSMAPSLGHRRTESAR